MVGRSQAITSHPLTHLRLQRGWSYQDLVDAVAAKARDMGIRNMASRREKAWRWERWGVEPDMETQCALAAVFDISPEEIQRHKWPSWLSEDSEIQTQDPWTQQDAITILERELENILFDRRGFLILSGSAVAAMTNSWAVIEPERVTNAMNGRVIDEEIVSWIEGRIPSLRRMDDKLGGAKLRDLVGAELHLVSDLIANGTYTSRLGRRLFSAAAQLGQLAGWVSFDTGLNAAAQRYYHMALRTAHVADDRALGGHILSCMSFQNVIAGDPLDAVNFSQAAVLHGSRNASARVKSFLATREASAYARAGDVRAFSKALSRANKEFDQAHLEADPSWIYFFDEAELIAQAGACYLNLGMLQKANAELETALANQDSSYVRDRILYQTRRATTQFKLGNLDHACALATEAASLTKKARSRRSTEAVRDFRALLASSEGEPMVRELDDYIQVLT